MIKVKDGYAKLIGTTYQGSATQVLLSNGGDLEYSASSKASTLVQRNASQHIYATYFNSAISDEALTDIGSVYVRNTSDTFIRRVSKTQFYSILDNKFVTLDTAQTITGVKTFSTGPILANNATITQNQNSTSNYTTVVKWLKGGTSQGTYNPSIGQHNTGGDGTGSICILPYPTSTDPQGGTVGLFIGKGVLRLDGKAVAIAENYYTKTESDERYVNVTGDTMTGPLIVKASITGTQLISNIADGTAPLKVTSKTVVTNLNSDLLDGYHETSFFRARGSQTIASSIPTTTELSSNNNLSGNWNVTYPGASGHLVQFNTESGSTRYMQFYSYYSGSLYWRNSTDSTLNTKSWKTIVDSANYTGIVLKIGTATKGSATLPIYLNAGTPTACSTTLGVSITGNAATATKLQTARTINGTSFNGTTNIVTAYWGTARTISLSGAVTGSASVNGSQNVTITTTYQFGSIDGRYVGGNKTANHGSSGTAYTADTYSSNFVNKAFVAFAERGSLAYANNGYITTDTGVNIPLAGTAIFQWGASDTNKTQLFITPMNNSGVSNPAVNEMLFYTSNGSEYSSGWSRVLTNRNYTIYTVTKTGGGASGTWGISITGNAATATTAQYLAFNSRMDYGWNGLNYFNIYGTAGTAVKANNTPTTAWWHILRFNHANSSGYYTDLAVPFNANSLYYKRVADGVLQNGKWVKVLDELNYTETLDSRYVTLTTNQTVSGIKTFSTQQKFTVATGTSPFTVSSTTVVSNLNADMLDGYHANSFIKIVGTRFSQYQQGTYTKILEFTITSGSLQPSITFTWHPSECARDVWADFSINIRSSAIIFYANWKGAVRRSLWCVGNGTTYSVWVSGTKSLWDPYGVVQVMSTWEINTYKVGSLQYADTAPSDTYSATAITSGWASRVVGTLTMTAGKFSSETYNGSADVAVSIPTHFSHLTNDNKNLVIKFNGGTTEGTNMFTYNGSTAKSPNITLTAIGSGLLHNSLAVQLAETTADSGWSMINSSYNGFILKSIRTQASAPSWILGNYSAGICFGGADTKGVISCAFNTSSIRFAGGNSSKPVWWMGITGSSGATYNLANMWTGTRYWANVAVSTASSTSTQPTFNTCYTSNWFRSTGNTGWHSESYGGGWYMTDSTWIRTYGSKSVYQNTGQIRTDGYLVTNGGITIGATSPNNGTYKSHVTGNSWSSGYIRAGAGFYHNSVNSNNYVLLAGGSYKSLADFAKGNAGASNRGVYVTNGTVTAMTYYLNATVNSGASGKLAYYSGTNSIDDYTNTIGSSSTPIYINNGIPNAANSYKVVKSGHYFSAFGISGYIYVIRYGQVVCVSINMSSSGNGSTGTTTLLTNLPSAVYTTGQSASKGGGSALRQATFYISGTTLYVYSYQADSLPNKVSFTYITNTLE